MAKPLKVWDGSEWVEVAAQLVDTSSFISAATASATYLAQDTASATYVTSDEVISLILALS